MNQTITEFIKPSATLLYNGTMPLTGLELLQHIERCGRTCYRSEEKITSTSAIQFCRSLFTRRHFSVIEHSLVVLKTIDCYDDLGQRVYSLFGPKAFKFLDLHVDDAGYQYLHGNLRAFFELFNLRDDHSFIHEVRSKLSRMLPDLMMPWPPPDYESVELITDFDELPLACRRYSMEFICDRGISHELVRHRPASFSQESTRYVDYNNKQEFKFIIPDNFETDDDCAFHVWAFSMESSEESYLRMSAHNQTAQRCRGVLPNAFATKLIMTTNHEHWKYVLNLRSASGCHPQMIQLMRLAQAQFDLYKVNLD